jgi:hypothetical protein
MIPPNQCSKSTCTKGPPGKSKPGAVASDIKFTELNLVSSANIGFIITKLRKTIRALIMMDWKVFLIKNSINLSEIESKKIVPLNM